MDLLPSWQHIYVCTADRGRAAGPHHSSLLLQRLRSLKPAATRMHFNLTPSWQRMSTQRNAAIHSTHGQPDQQTHVVSCTLLCSALQQERGRQLWVQCILHHIPADYGCLRDGGALLALAALPVLLRARLRLLHLHAIEL